MEARWLRYEGPISLVLTKHPAACIVKGMDGALYVHQSKSVRMADEPLNRHDTVTEWLDTQVVRGGP